MRNQIVFPAFRMRHYCRSNANAIGSTVASAAEGVQLAREITEFVEEIRALGPLKWSTGLRPPASHIEQPAVAEEVMA